MSTKRKILLTNDDGIASPGLTTLASHLLATGRYELRIAAPEQEQSGVGHAVTLHTPLFVEPVILREALAAVPAFLVAGTPADCVKLALTNLFPDFAPDLVVSGINPGPNIGVNVFYSGTVAGALEAAINGFPAVALSLDIPPGGLWHFALATELSLPVLDLVLERGLPPWTILNVNVPNRPQKEIRGLRLTEHGRSGFREYYIEEEAEGPRRRFRLEGEMIYRDTAPLTDSQSLRDGWISITPLGLRLLDQSAWDHVAPWGPLHTKTGTTDEHR